MGSEGVTWAARASRGKLPVACERTSCLAISASPRFCSRKTNESVALACGQHAASAGEWAGVGGNGWERAGGVGVRGREWVGGGREWA